MPANIICPTDRPIFFQYTDNFGIECYQSYRTFVGFYDRESGERCVAQNVWESTTGKHLNYIDNGDKSERLPRREVVARYHALCEYYERQKYRKWLADYTREKRNKKRRVQRHRHKQAAQVIANDPYAIEI